MEVDSGKRNDRPVVAEALRLRRQQKAALVIAKLDRPARNVHFISGLMQSGVEFLAVGMPGANRFVVHILAVVAKQEAESHQQANKSGAGCSEGARNEAGGRRVLAERFAEIAASARQIF